MEASKFIYCGVLEFEDGEDGDQSSQQTDMSFLGMDFERMWMDYHSDRTLEGSETADFFVFGMGVRRSLPDCGILSTDLKAGMRYVEFARYTM